MIILIIGMFFSLISCSDDDSMLKTINFLLIGQGELYGNGVEGIAQSNLVINDTNTWNDLMVKMNSVNNVTNDFTETNIDFDQYQVIAIFDQIYGSGGHSIDIKKITENETNVIVKVENLLNGDDTLVITQPFHIVKISKSEKLIVFE